MYLAYAKHSSFSLLTVVLYYKDAAYTELVDTEPLLLEELQR